jgi:hypothetical protein
MLCLPRPPAAPRAARPTKLGAQQLVRNRRDVDKYHPNTLPVNDYDTHCAAKINLPCGNIAHSNGTGCGLYDLAQRLCSGGNQASRCGAAAQNFVYYDYVGCHKEPWSGRKEQGHVFNIAVPPVRCRVPCRRPRPPPAASTKPTPQLWLLAPPCAGPAQNLCPPPRCAASRTWWTTRQPPT